MKVLVLATAAYLVNALFWTGTWQVEHYGIGQLVLVSLLFAGLSVAYVRVGLSIRTVTLTCAVIYFSWGLIAGVTPASDFEIFFRHAAAFADSPNFETLFDTKSPPTVLYYSLFLWLFGASYATGYLASAIIWAAQLPLLCAALARFGVRRSTSVLAAALYGFAPATIAFAPVMSSESVFNFLVVVNLLLLGRFGQDAKMRDVVAASACGGLLFLTRGNGIVFFATSIGFVIWGRRKVARRQLQLGAAALLPFTLLLALQASLNLAYGGNFSPSPSKWASYNLLAGTNRESRGTFNRSDLRLAGFAGEDKVSHSEASAAARRIAFERVSEAPVSFLGFALSEKVGRLWEKDSQSLHWAIKKALRKKTLQHGRTDDSLRKVIDAYYWLVLMLAALYLLDRLRSREAMTEGRALVLVFAMPVLLTGVLHIILEVQPRYHTPLMPLLYSSAALTLSEVWRSFRTRRGCPSFPSDA